MTSTSALLPESPSSVTGTLCLDLPEFLRLMTALASRSGETRQRNGMRPGFHWRSIMVVSIAAYASTGPAYGHSGRPSFLCEETGTRLGKQMRRKRSPPPRLQNAHYPTNFPRESEMSMEQDCEPRRGPQRGYVLSSECAADLNGRDRGSEHGRYR
jgi:hypothetical protein